MFLSFSPRIYSLCSFQGTLVGSSGFEPPTSRLSGVRSNQLSYEPIPGGDERVRTDGLLLARQALSQLSYTPTQFPLRPLQALLFESALAPSKPYSASDFPSTLPKSFCLSLLVGLFTLERR